MSTVRDNPTTGNDISGNAIFSNTQLGIELQGAGVTLNDTNDPDTGANNVQNYPDLTSAITAGERILIEGSLDSLASTAFRIDFYANTAADTYSASKSAEHPGFLWGRGALSRLRDRDNQRVR